MKKKKVFSTLGIITLMTIRDFEKYQNIEICF